MYRLLARLAAATVAVAAAGAVAGPVPASADACASSAGVTAVVDHNELGGGVHQVCVADGGGDTAAEVFTAAGYPLTYAQRDPGFVCRVDGVPASDPCVNASPSDAYWALYWSDGESGSWTYSSLGAGSLTLPEGAYVAFSWQGSTTKSPPSATPTPHGAAAAGPSAGPTKQPAPQGGGPTTSAGPGRGPSATPGGPAGTAPTAAAATGSATPGGDGHGKHSPGSRPSGAGDNGKGGKGRGPRAEPSAGSTTDATATAAPTDAPAVGADTTPTAAEPADDGLPAWVPLVFVAVLLGAVAAVAVRRRTTGRP